YTHSTTLQSTHRPPPHHPPRRLPFLPNTGDPSSRHPIHSFTHPLIHSLSPSPPPAREFTLSAQDRCSIWPPPHSLIHSLTHSLIVSLTSHDRPVEQPCLSNRGLSYRHHTIPLFLN